MLNIQVNDREDGRKDLYLNEITFVISEFDLLQIESVVADALGHEVVDGRVVLSKAKYTIRDAAIIPLHTTSKNNDFKAVGTDELLQSKKQMKGGPA